MHNLNLPFEVKYPALVCAPMVDQSELPFRILCRRYKSNLCYTPMLHSRMMISVKSYMNQHFTTSPEDRPLVAQICGDDPEIMVKAAKLLEPHVDAIDINLGCPQGIARRGHYGSFLLEEPQLIERIVRALVKELRVPIFCKIRIRKSEEKTMEVVDRIVAAGCSLLTVHGRTKEQNKDRVGSCDWAIIKKIKERVNIPVIANGGIFNYEDVIRCLEETGADGVMSAEALLENPALFSGDIICLDRLAREYLQLAQHYPGASSSCLKAHLFKILHTGLATHVDLRDRLAKCSQMDQFIQIASQLAVRREAVPPMDKFGWYKRYWKALPILPPLPEDKPTEPQQEPTLLPNPV